jgi:serine/threonine protein kinase
VQSETLPKEVVEAAQFPENDFGKYILISLLGRGGMGEVYKAWEKTLSRYVALKLLKEIDKDNMMRFEREARLAAGLTHQNIAAIYELGHHNGKTYIAMQYIEGKTLEKFAGDIEIGVRAIHQAAEALSFAHSKGVIHRDINPRNIMVDDQDQAFVMDFGIARRKAQGSTITETGLVVGTPGYMSPEQAQGLNLDERTDVYSLGATLYYVCTHTAPFLGDEAINIVLRVVNEDPQPIRHLNPRVDRHLTTIIEKAMEKDPKRRYANAKELEEDLRRYRANEPILARRRTFLERAFRRFRKHRLAYVMASIFFVLLAAGATMLVSRGFFERKEDKRDQAFELLPQLERIITEFELDSSWDESEIASRKDRFNSMFKEIMTIQKEFSYAYVERAHLHWLLGDRDKAFEDIQAALRSEKDNAQAHVDLGRYKLKEYISAKIRQTARALSASLFAPMADPALPKEDTPEMTAKLKEGLKDFSSFQKLTRRRTGQPAAGEADYAFAQAVEALVEGKRDVALEKLKRAKDSRFVSKDAKLLMAVVACEDGRYDLIEEALSDQKAPTRDYVEVRTYIAISLFFGLRKETHEEAEKALVENLARLMLVSPSTRSALQLPGTVQGELEPYLQRAEKRVQELRGR